MHNTMTGVARVVVTVMLIEVNWKELHLAKMMMKYVSLILKQSIPTSMLFGEGIVLSVPMCGTKINLLLKENFFTSSQFSHLASSCVGDKDPHPNLTE